MIRNFLAAATPSARRSPPFALLGALGLSALSFTNCSSSSSTKRTCQTEGISTNTTSTIVNNDEYNDDDVEWKFPNRSEFDIYIDHPHRNDLIKLFTAHNKGLSVWPWIWTQPNEMGPHHVFVGPVSVDVLQRIKKIKETVPNVNLLVIADHESVLSLPEGEQSLYRYECGLVLDTPVTLSDYENKILMLKDERVITYSTLYMTD